MAMNWKAFSAGRHLSIYVNRTHPFAKLGMGQHEASRYPRSRLQGTPAMPCSADPVGPSVWVPEVWHPRPPVGVAVLRGL